MWIIENTLIALEIFMTISKKRGKGGLMVTNLDMKKHMT